MSAGNDSLDLLGLFVNNFDVQTIYELGWYASMQWMTVISAILIAIAIAIRSLEEKVNLASGGQTNYQKFFVTSMLVAVAMGLYFTFAWAIIQFFNSIYGLIDTSDGVKAMANQLDDIMSSLLSAEYEFSWSDVYNSVYAAFATIAYAITFCVLIFCILAMRIAHAALISFCLFWGAVALPMSITLGIKQLTAFKNIVITALIWPIIDAFLMYLISGSFAEMLAKSGMGIGNIDTWSLGTVVFYLGAFSIINCILVATTLSAPFIAQGLANGTGNVTGMIGAFGAAGVAAGTIAGKYMADKANVLGKRGQESVPKAFNGAKNMLSPPNNTSNESLITMSKLSPGFSEVLNTGNKTENTRNPTSNSNTTSHNSRSASSSTSRAANTTSNSNNSNNSSNSGSPNSLKNGHSNNNAPEPKSSEGPSSLKTGNSTLNLSNSSGMSNEQQINANNMKTPEETAEEAKQRKKDNARRIQIINHQRKNKPKQG